MARYILDDNFIKLNESYGTLENISDFEAQIYTSATRDEGMILYPHQRISFNKPLYVARASGESGYPVLATMPYMGGEVIGGGAMLEDDNCGCGNANFDISIVTNNCGCSNTETITVPAVMDSDCKCEYTCTSEVSVVPVPVTLPTSCECCCEGGQVTTIPTTTNIKRSGTYNVSIPIVINVNGGCGCNCGTADSTIKNDNITDTLEGYFGDKETLDSGDGGSIIATLQSYFNDKDPVNGSGDSPSSYTESGRSIIGDLNNYFNGRGD